MRCPCRKKSEAIEYSGCCEPYHSYARVAPTAEALMRSRYSAFALRDEAYLMSTWHASTRGKSIILAPDQEWILLRIHEICEECDRATVEFTARSKIGGRSQVQHERSSFVRENGRWFYVRPEASGESPNN